MQANDTILSIPGIDAGPCQKLLYFLLFCNFNILHGFIFEGISNLGLLHFEQNLEYIEYINFPLCFVFFKIFVTIDPTDNSIAAIGSDCLNWMRLIALTGCASLGF